MNRNCSLLISFRTQINILLQFFCSPPASASHTLQGSSDIRAVGDVKAFRQALLSIL